MITGIFGVNIAVHDLAAATAKYENVFGVKSVALGEKDFAFPGLSGAQLAIGDFHINLITSHHADTSISKFLERKGEGLFLLSVKVDAIDDDIADLRQKGCQLLLNDSVNGDFGAVNFVHPKSMNGVQVEIYQPACPAKG